MFTAIRVKLDVYRRVKEVAEREQRTQSVIVQRALDAYLREQRAGPDKVKDGER